MVTLGDYVGQLLSEISMATPSGYEGDLSQVEAILCSMTPDERRRPEIIGGSRARRIANGSGTTLVDVNRLLEQLRLIESSPTADGRSAEDGKLFPFRVLRPVRRFARSRNAIQTHPFEPPVLTGKPDATAPFFHKLYHAMTEQGVEGSPYVASDFLTNQGVGEIDDLSEFGRELISLFLTIAPGVDEALIDRFLEDRTEELEEYLAGAYAQDFAECRGQLVGKLCIGDSRPPGYS